MLRITSFFVGLGILAGVALFAQQKTAAPKITPLTALDYIEIEQLNHKYAFALDTCSNKGEDYANLYTEDGVFIVGLNGLEYRGHAQLVNAAGGPTCERLARLPNQTHTTVNIVIEASPEGATGKSYLVYPGVRGEHADADHSGHVGGYQDVYVKTAKGWRFKSRVHVFPPQIPGQYKGIPNDPTLAKGKAK
jgi:hypothetical protein